MGEIGYGNKYPGDNEHIIDITAQKNDTTKHINSDDASPNYIMKLSEDVISTIISMSGASKVRTEEMLYELGRLDLVVNLNNSGKLELIKYIPNK